MERKSTKKISMIILVCFCIHLMVSLSAISSNAAAVNDYTQWKQWDSAWNQQEAWSASQYPGATAHWMKEAGCVVTSIAMLLRHYNVVTDSDVNNFNPWIFNEQLKNAGAFNSAADLVWGKVQNVYPSFVYQNTVSYSLSTLQSLYNQGYACIVHASSTHYVAVKEVSGSTVTIMDPGYSNRPTLGSYSNPTQIVYYKAPNPTPKDEEAPNISNVQVTNINPSGFTVSCTATDNVGVTSVKFPTWRSRFSAEGCTWYEGTRNGNTWSFTFKDAVYDDYYTTHIYAYDAAGNAAKANGGDTECRRTGSTLEIDEEATYRIASVMDTAQVIDINGDNARMWSADSQSENQEFSIQSLGNGYYRIVAKYSGKALDVYGASATNNTNLQQWEINDGDAQAFKFASAGNGNYYIISKLGTYVDAYGGTATNGTNVSMVRYYGGANQQWKLVKSHTHQYEIAETKETTCNEIGYTEFSCTCGDSYKEYDGSVEYSDWTEKKAEQYKLYASKDQYRYKKYETKEVSSPSEVGSDWKQVSSNTSWTDYGAWSDWQDNAVSSNDTTQVETRTVYRYYYFLCPVCGGHEPFWGLQSDCHQYTLQLTDGKTGWFTTPYSQCNGQTYSYTSAKRYTESLGDGQRWNFNTSNITNAAPGTTDDDGITILVKNQYRYRSRSQVTKYTYRRMTGYSEWTDNESDIPAGAEKETRTVYRYVITGLKDHDEEIRDAIEATEEAEGYTGDTYCKVCGTKLKDGEVIPKKDSIDPDPTPVDPDAIAVTVSSVSGRAGTEITVPVTIKNNPGIAGYSFDVNYDSSVLTLKQIKQGSLLTTGQLTTNGDVFNWYTDDNITGDGEICSFIFAINKDAAAGSTSVSVALHDGKKNLVNEDSTYVAAEYVAGSVQVTRGITGDVNGDEEITIGDVVMLNRAVLGKVNLSAEVKALADANADGDITIGDVVYLNRYVLGKIKKLGGANGLDENSAGSASLTLAAAEDGLTVSIEDVTVKPGEKISVPVQISNNPGIAGFAFTVKLPQGVSLESMTAGEILAGGIFTADGQNCTWYTSDNVFGNGTLLTLNLTAAEDVQSGEMSIELLNQKANNMVDEDSVTVPITFIAGELTVEREEVCAHKGGKATCVDKAVCEVCGEAYGEVDPDNHVGETEVREAKEATETETGYTGDTYCKACGTLLSKGEEIPQREKVTEAEPESETEKQEPVTEKPEPTTEKPEPTTEKPEPTTEKPEPTTEKPEPTTEKPEPTTEKPEPTAEKPEPTTEKPEPTTENPQSTKPAVGTMAEVDGSQYRIVMTDGKEGAALLAAAKNVKNVPKTVQIAGQKYAITAIGDKAFYKNKKLSSVTIPDTVVTIGKSAFQGCINLKKVTIGKSVKQIGVSAFNGCKKLKSVKVNTKQLQSVGKKAFSGTDKRLVIKVPKKSKKKYSKLFRNKGMKKTAKVR